MKKLKLTWLNNLYIDVYSLYLKTFRPTYWKSLCEERDRAITGFMMYCNLKKHKKEEK